jgi:hypothetical protein
MTNGNDIEVVWHSDKKKRKKNNRLYCIDKELVKVLLHEMMKKNITPGLGDEISIEGYTRATIITKNENRVIFYAHPHFQGRKWYDWAYVHFEEITASGESVEAYYPSKILGFIKMSGSTEVVIQCSEKPLIWSDVEKHFIVKIKIGTDIKISYVTVPITALVHPLCVIPDGGDLTSYIIILPKRNWSRYFGDRVLSEYNKSLKK